MSDGARRRKPLALQGSVWLTSGKANFGGHGRIGLLQAIAQTGSITHAAKAIGMSYKAAWDAVDTMNNLAGEPLVERATGGRGGGYTKLTPRGEELIARFAQVEAAHARFVKLLNAEAEGLYAELDLLKTLNMKTSARNQFLGTVTALRVGAVNDEVELTLPGGQRIVAIITRESTDALGLKIKTKAFALVKASSVIIARGEERLPLSARNQLRGTVASITPGVVNAEVRIDLHGGGHLAATVTDDSLQALQLAVGDNAIGVFKASSVIIGIPV